MGHTPDNAKTFKQIVEPHVPDTSPHQASTNGSSLVLKEQLSHLDGAYGRWT